MNIMITVLCSALESLRTDWSDCGASISRKLHFSGF